MSLLCDRAKNKLDKSKRKYKECPQSKSPDREAELFCENCGHSLGKEDVLIIDLETVKYCSKCIEKYIKETPFDIPDGTVVKDFGDSVYLQKKFLKYMPRKLRLRRMWIFIQLPEWQLELPAQSLQIL